MIHTYPRGNTQAKALMLLKEVEKENVTLRNILCWDVTQRCCLNIHRCYNLIIYRALQGNQTPPSINPRILYDTQNDVTLKIHIHYVPGFAAWSK